MANLTEKSSYEELKIFLLHHMDQADERPAKNNMNITKKDVWNIAMGAALDNAMKVKTMAINKSIREFGSYYEENRKGDVNES